jgi:endonuclease/exonuclease/phosphatase family metal-dependent hydrolase
MILNAKIGRDETYIGTVGNRNDNGQRLIEFAFSKDLVVSSTYFPHKDIHKYTLTSPGEITHNQIDHLLIERRNASSIIDVRTCRGANCGSDHHLVKAVYLLT